MGAQARRFVDVLVSAGVSVWQVPPFGPGFGVLNVAGQA